MKKSVLILSSFVLVSSTIAFGVEADPHHLAHATEGLGATPDFLDFLVASFNGIRGAGIFGAAAIMIQLLIKAIDQPFAKKFFSNSSGLNKMLIVTGLTFAVTPIGLVSGAGLGLGAALLHSSTLTTFMVFLNQLYQHAVADKARKAELKALNVK